MGYITMHEGMVDEIGLPIERTPHKYPYSFDFYVIHKNPEAVVDENTIYSDRLLQWDWDKHNALCKKHFGDEGQMWDSRDPSKIEAFLRDWHDDPELILNRIMKGCNVSSGYPLWAFTVGRKNSNVKFVISGDARKAMKKELAELVSFVTNFAHNNDVSTVYGTGMSEEKSRDILQEARNKAKALSIKLNHREA